jgi:DnaD/phage-associated family protein
MAFHIKQSELDLGTTEIENMFINIYMPQANGTHVKVYLMGYYLARHHHPSTNESLAKTLMLSIEDVVQAWVFWESKGIVQCHEASDQESPHLFDISFICIRENYISHNFSKSMTNAPKLLSYDAPETPSDRVFSAMSNPILKTMFANIQYMVRRMLTPQEHVRILNWMTDYKMDPDMIEKAFHITFEERKIKDFHFNYVEGIISKWYDKRILTIDALEAYASEIDKRHILYKQVYQAIGVQNRSISAGDKELVDTWCDREGLNGELILKIVKEASKRTTNPNLNYISKVIANIKTVNDLTDEGITTYFSTPKPTTELAYEAKVPRAKKQSFQNFKQTTISNMSESEMRDILKRKSEKRLNSKGELKT